jgi:hypothetical protein
MPGTVIGKSMNAGYPGTYARNADCVISNRLVKSTDSVGPNFGDPVILNSDNTLSKINGAFAFADFYGFAVREVKTPQSYMTPETIGNYAPGQPCDALRRGTISAICRVGTPTAGGNVWVRTVLGTSPPAGAVVGGIETAVPSNTGAAGVQLTNCEFETGYMDANKVTEIRVKTIN